MEALHQLEILWLMFLQSITHWLVTPMQLVSMLGQEEFYMLIMPSLYWCLDSALGLRVAVMLLLSNGINGIFKVAFHAPRPYWFDPRVKGLSVETSFGMPSGHAQNAASVWGIMAAATSQKWAKVTLVILIFLIGFSRLVLGMHFISDVLVGWLLGGFTLWIFLKVERPIASWLLARSLNQQIALALLTALLIGLAMFIATAAASSIAVPAEWANNALTAHPSEPINPLNQDGTFTIAGTWFGLMSGCAWLFHRQGGFDASGSATQRLSRYVIGVAGIFVLWFGLGQVFPRSADALSYTLRFARYTLVGLWISAIAPLLFARLGLAVKPGGQVGSFSSQQNPL